MLSDFKKFILRGNVVDLAVGVVMGVAFGAVITAIVSGLLTPIIAAVVGKPHFSALHFTIHHSAFLYGSVIVAVVMALGGIFGVMNTMFAAVAQRIKDIGVMRILGFKRWQVLVSFLLESLVIAIAGGLLGLLLGSLCHGLTATSVSQTGHRNCSLHTEHCDQPDA